MKSKYLYSKVKEVYFDDLVIEYLVAKEIASLDKYNEIGEEVLNKVVKTLENRNIKVKKSILSNYIFKILKVYRKNIGCPLFQTFESIFKSTDIVYLNAYRLKDRVTLINDLSRIFLQTDIYIEDYLPYVISGLNSFNEFNELKIKSYIFNFLYNYDSVKEKVINAIKEVDLSYEEVDISLLFKNKKLIKLLYRNAVNTFKDLKELDSDLITLLVFFDYPLFINKLKLMKEELTNEVLLSIINDAFTKLTKIEYHVLSLKEGFNDTKKYSNEEIALKVSRAKDRVRIILNSINTKIKQSKLDEISLPLFVTFLKVKNNEKYLSFEGLISYFNDESIVNKLIYLYSLDVSNISYSSNYHILYLPYEFSIRSYIDDFLKEHSLYVLGLDYETSSLFKKAIIKENYRFIANKNYYLRKGKNESEIIALLLETEFKDGFKVNDLNVLYLVNEKLIEKFNTNFNLTNRSLEGIITKYNFTLIDKGTYKSSKRVVKLNEELVDSILDYIDSTNGSVKYVTIFNKFKKELKEYGVLNQYYLKGIIDSYLSELYIHTRDYIKPLKLKDSFKKMTIYYLNSIDGKVTFKEFNALHKEINEYIFLNAIHSLNRYVQFENEEFIPLKDFALSKELIDKLKEIINEYLKKNSLDFLTSRGLFDYIFNAHKEEYDYLISLNISNHFRLYSLLHTLFNDFYYYKRPIISIKKLNSLNRFEMIASYLNSLNEFDSKDLLSYIKEYSLRPIQNYLEFYLDYLPDFILVDKNKFIKKELLVVNDNNLLEIKDFLLSYLSTNEKLDSSEFNAYKALPLLNYSWNKYLLFGVINSYLSNLFNLTIVSNSLRNGDYTIALK